MLEGTILLLDPLAGAIGPNWVSEQIVAVWLIIEGVGLTVTTTLKLLVQEPDVAVTLYVAVWFEFVGFVSVCEILDSPFVWLLPPVRPPVTFGDPQV